MTQATVKNTGASLPVKLNPHLAGFVNADLAPGASGPLVLTSDPMHLGEIVQHPAGPGSVEVTADASQAVRWSYGSAGPWTDIPAGQMASVSLDKGQRMHVAVVLAT